MPREMVAMGEEIDDASITVLVKTALFYHRSTSGLYTTVETKDGLVTWREKPGPEPKRISPANTPGTFTASGRSTTT